MKSHSIAKRLVAGALVSAALAFCATAQQSQNGISSATPSTASAASRASSAKPTPAANPSAAGMAEILKMLDAGISQEVIKAYIEHAPVVYQPSASDIIGLKDRGVSDEIMIALLKRSADLRNQASQAQASAAAAARLLRSRNYGGLDPESYEYFQNYYLFPRTLDSVNQRLGYYYYYPPAFYPPPFYPSPYWRW